MTESLAEYCERVAKKIRLEAAIRATYFDESVMFGAARALEEIAIWAKENEKPACDHRYVEIETGACVKCGEQVEEPETPDSMVFDQHSVRGPEQAEFLKK